MTDEEKLKYFDTVLYGNVPYGSDSLEQIMRDKLADSLAEFHQWVDLIRSGEAEVTGLTVTRKHKWVGLTDEDKALFSSWLDHKTDAEVFTAIEAKLKEKNA
jgi:hypothetical protein